MRIDLDILVTLGCALDRYAEYVDEYGDQDYEPGEPEEILQRIEQAQTWLVAQEAK